MNILLTGGSGFIGSSVLKILSKKKDIKIYATYKNKKPKFSSDKNTKWVKFDIFKLSDFKLDFKMIDVVIHLSWPYLPDYTTRNHLNKNLKAQKSFLNRLIKSGIKNFFIAGTCYEYGLRSGRLLETTKKTPNNSYASSKNQLREYLFKLNKNNRINITWGRIFYIYGINKRRDTLYNLVLNLKKRKDMTVASNFYRDYLNIDILANIIVILSLKKENFGEINLCSGFSISLKKLINYFCKINNINNDISYKKKISKFEANNFFGDNKKLMKILRNSLSVKNYERIKLLMVEHKK